MLTLLYLFQLFVELDELITQQHDDEVELWEWREKARWIKFEEDVLGAADRWGRPHVASLSFQSLIHLHKALENGKCSQKDPHEILFLSVPQR